LLLAIQNIISDTDSTDSLGSTTVRWLKGWFDTLTAGTLTIGGGTITDSSGAITFGNENLVTTGTLGSGALTATTIAGTTGDFSGNVTITKAGDITTSVFDTTTGVAGSTRTLAEHYVQGKSNSGATVNFQNITYNSADATNGSEDGSQIHYQMLAGTSTAWLNVDGINATFAGDVSVGGTALISDSTTHDVLSIGVATGTSHGQAIKLINSGSTNFQISSNYQVGNSFAISRSTAAGGTTFTNNDFIIDSTGNATFAGDVSVGGGTGAWLTAWKDNSNSGNQFLIGDTEGVNAAIRTYSTSDPAGLIMNYYYAVAGSPYLRYADIVSNQGTGAAAGIRLITKNAANAYSATVIDGDGNATFAGSISKASGSFKIPHPLPELNETHNLVHSFVESPRAENLYSGMVNLVDGTASVNIDTHSGMTEGTFEALNTLLTHSSSNEGGYSPVKCSVVGNVITINCQDATSTDKVYWEVRGERKDQHMLDTEWTDDEGHVIVEPLKDVVEAVVEEVVENV
jgi:hypothetical protein